MHYHHLSVGEREEIQLGLWQNVSIRSLAKRLKRSPSSLAREIQRNLPPERRQYTPRVAHERALEHRSFRGRTERLKSDCIRTYAVAKLKAGFSPEQIAGRIRSDLHVRISHEAIYQFIYAQIRRRGNGSVKPGCEDLRPYLKRRHKRRAKKGMRKGQRVSKPNGPSIDERPVIVEKRSRIGDWEGDTVESAHHAPGINTLVERKSGLALITKVRDKTAGATREAIAKRLASLPAHCRRTLAVDNGPENRQWEDVEEAAGICCFFAHPYHSWERETNENTNGLIRWYFPKGTDFRMIPDEDIAKVQHALNTRPRKRLGWRTPLEVFTRGVELHY